MVYRDQDFQKGNHRGYLLWKPWVSHIQLLQSTIHPSLDYQDRCVMGFAHNLFEEQFRGSIKYWVIIFNPKNLLNLFASLAVLATALLICKVKSANKLSCNETINNFRQHTLFRELYYLVLYDFPFFMFDGMIMMTLLS